MQGRGGGGGWRKTETTHAKYCACMYTVGTVPPGTIDPSGLGHTLSFLRVVAARPPR